MPPMNTLFGTVDVRSSPAAANNIGAITAAPDAVTVRVLIRNIGPTDIIVGLTPAAVAGNAVGANSNFRLPAGDADVFVLAPRQTLYAVAIGGGGRVSFAMSAALPIDVVHA